jgi:hypothetical protein
MAGLAGALVNGLIDEAYRTRSCKATDRSIHAKNVDDRNEASILSQTRSPLCSIGGPIILGRCPSRACYELTLSAGRNERERERERESEKQANGTWEKHTVH